MRDFIQFKDQQIKNGVIGMCGSSSARVITPNVIGGGVNPSSVVTNNFDYDFTSDDHIEQNTGILNSNNSNIKVNNDTVNQTNTLEDENLVQKIQLNLENFKKAKTENIAWVNRLQSKMRIYF